MTLTIEKSKESDIDNIMPLFDAARTTMAKLGIDQIYKVTYKQAKAMLSSVAPIL